MSVPTVNTKLKSDSKVLIINGSPHENGHTVRLMKSFLNGCPETIKLEQFDTFKNIPYPCDDCGVCKTKECCKYNDLDKLYKEFEECDLIVFATPVYNYSFPAPLKALIDRFQRYFNARFVLNKKPPIAKNRKAVIVSTCGSEDNKGFEIIEFQLLKAFTILNVDLVGTVYCNNTDKQDVNKDVLKSAEYLAKAIF